MTPPPKKTARERLDAARVGLDMKLHRCACGAFATRHTFWMWKDTKPGAPMPERMVDAMRQASAFAATNQPFAFQTCDECEPMRPINTNDVANFQEGEMQQAKTARRLNAIAWGDDEE